MTEPLNDQTLVLEEIKEVLEGKYDDELTDTAFAYGELTVTVRKEAIEKVLIFLRDDAACQFKQLIDICGVDYPKRNPRFDVVYHLLSMKHNVRLRVKVAVAEDEPVATVTGIYAAANWFEREAWDMYGIFFDGHPDPRRMLTDYGFEGHPLRRDFPMTGYVEMRYDEEKKRCVYEPVTLVQDYRSFDFLSPWEGAQAILPGDEKA